MYFSILPQDLDSVPIVGSSKDAPLVLHPAALYGIAGDVVTACTEGTEATTPGVLFYFLQQFGCHVGPFSYYPVSAEKHCARLFVTLVGKSSKARKGTSMRPVDVIFERVQSTFGRSLAPIRNTCISSGEGLVAAVRDSSDELDDDGIPVHQGISDKRCLMVSEEMSSTIAAMKRSGNTVSSVIRSLWDIGKADFVTKHDQMKTTNAHLCLMNHVTESELKGSLDQVELFNGFANRFLWVYVSREKVVAIPKALDDSIIFNLAERINNALAFGGRPQEIRFDDEAAEHWENLYLEISRHDESKSPIHEAVTSRGEAYVLRLALIYALLDRSATIRLVHLQAATACWQYCDESAKRIFDGQKMDKDDKKKGAILKHLSSGPSSKRSLFALFSNNIGREELSGLLDDLADKNLITSLVETIPGSNKPTTLYSLAQSG